MSSLLDEPDVDFVVIINDEQQHSLWPASLAVPEGWTVAFGPTAKSDCLDYVRSNWTDMRPVSAR